MDYTEELRVVNPGLVWLIMQTSFVNKYNNLLAITIIQKATVFVYCVTKKDKFESFRLDTWWGTDPLPQTLILKSYIFVT